ncbi:MAG: SGNH/GDSL hydrolase family protein [Thermoanaerobaculia bacterium]|nr:SGNH/GDSL hydrolase family protein [Thermoanaerobaculia bacterium]
MRYVNFFLNLALVSVAGTAKTQDIPVGANLPALKIRVVVIGSSTAAGAGAEPADSAWVNRYRAWLQGINPANEVLNLALGGYSTYQLLPSTLFPVKYRPAPDSLRNITRALSLRPHAIIINLPSNDVASGYNLEEQLANFDKIAKKARCAGVPVWIFTTQPRNFSADKVMLQLFARHAILDTYGPQAINVWDVLAEPNGLLDVRFNSGDGVHLNNEGHAMIFEQVKSAGIPEFVSRVPERSWLAKLWRIISF